ncbi:G-protein coupled receptor GRL101-like protein [Leptotrombidium deliense]|uniref:G-protein coupled receptor GRL101-like protein n=1 Tax=Leptotrombidium deliense TaxID=299467 RepID=A0A443SPP8_9ACAR|nr:G-protein coupled receptor GRL101-like protein [Leptotrombidium deliense]
MFLVCPSSHFKCDNYFCVPNEKVCDFVDDCGDFSDEKSCIPRRCWYKEFTCKNGECISFANVCNGIKDCVDGSDEIECDPKLILHFVECNDGSKVHISLWCDNWTDCSDNHLDELNCNAKTVHQMSTCVKIVDAFQDHTSAMDTVTVFLNVKMKRCTYEIQNGITVCANKYSIQCYDLYRCIDRKYICDGREDCAAGNRYSTDELGCGKNRKQCNETKGFWCSEGRCIPLTLRCNHIRDCLNGEDEINCGFNNCQVDYFKCNSGECIEKHKYCDSVAHCFDKSDETNCVDYKCPFDHFKCNTGQCIPKQWLCDFRRDCPQAEDELNCGSYSQQFVEKMIFNVLMVNVFHSTSIAILMETVGMDALIEVISLTGNVRIRNSNAKIAFA